MHRFYKQYRYSVHWSDEDGEYIGTCAEFPHLSWLEPDSDVSALAGIKSTVADVLEDMEQGGESPPTPLSYREARRSRVAALVELWHSKQHNSVVDVILKEPKTAACVIAAHVRDSLNEHDRYIFDCILEAKTDA